LQGRRRRRRFFYSPDRRGEHAERHLAGFHGTLQTDAYAGFNKLYDGGRRPTPVIEAACWAHGRRNFFELADPTLRKKNLLSPIALEAVKRIDAVFASAKSTVSRRRLASSRVSSASCHCSTSSKPGCRSGVPGCPVMPTSPKLSTTC
jgi:hypothetical protein